MNMKFRNWSWIFLFIFLSQSAKSQSTGFLRAHGKWIVDGHALLAAPTASLVASFYLDDIADVVEREIDPTGPRGRPWYALRSMWGCDSPLSP